MEYFLHKDGQNLGPYDEATLKTMLAQGQILSSDLIWNDQMPNWETMESVLPQTPKPAAPIPVAAAPVAAAPVAAAPVAAAPVAAAPVAAASAPTREEGKSQAIDAKPHQANLLKKAGIAFASIAIVAGIVWFFAFDKQAPSISDKIIIDAIRKEIGKAEGSLSSEDYLKVKNLELNSKQLTDIKIISELKQLEALQLADNKVSDLSPLAELSVLTKLDVSGNQITDLAPISSLFRIQELRVGGNQITDLAPLSKLKGLMALDAGSNKISDLQPLSSLPSLQTINLAENQIQSLEPLNSLKGLQQLIILGNPEIKQTNVDQLKTNLPKCAIEF